MCAVRREEGEGGEDVGVGREICVQILTDYRRNSRERPRYWVFGHSE